MACYGTAEAVPFRGGKFARSDEAANRRFGWESWVACYGTAEAMPFRGGKFAGSDDAAGRRFGWELWVALAWLKLCFCVRGRITGGLGIPAAAVLESSLLGDVIAALKQIPFENRKDGGRG